MGVTDDGIRRAGRWLTRAVLGPWPIFPGIVFGAMLSLVLLQNLQLSLLGDFSDCRYSCVDLPGAITPGIVSEFGSDALRPIDPVVVIGNAVLTALAIGIVLHVGVRLTRGRGMDMPSRGAYLLTIILACLAGAVVRVCVLSPIWLSVPEVTPGGIVATTVRTFVSVTVVQTLSGLLTRRYAEQVALARDALATVQQQQRLVVEADERARRSIAEFLHNCVQASLLVSAMELRAALDDADPATVARIERAVNEIERIRSEEVRSASRRLSPAFSSIGLDTALHEMADAWDPAMHVDITFDAAAHAVLVEGEPSADLVTAIYRIVEQGLLNAASHGHASRVVVSLSMPAAHTLVLRVEDDGDGLPDQTWTRGAGAAIIDAWCSVASGHWLWRPGRDRGTCLQAQFAMGAPSA